MTFKKKKPFFWLQIFFFFDRIRFYFYFWLHLKQAKSLFIACNHSWTMYFKASTSTIFRSVYWKIGTLWNEIWFVFYSCFKVFSGKQRKLLNRETNLVSPGPPTKISSSVPLKKKRKKKEKKSSFHEQVRLFFFFFQLPSNKLWKEMRIFRF